MSHEDQNPLQVVAHAIANPAFVESLLTHFGVFCVGGAIAVGVYSDEVSDTVCSPQLMLGGSKTYAANCEYLGNLSADMQLGLGAIAVVVLLTSEWMNRRRHRRETHQ